MLFDVIFYSALIGTTLGCIQWVRMRNPNFKIPRKLFRWSTGGLLMLICGTLWFMQGSLIFAPSGSRMHEVARLPKHFFNLRQYKAESIEMEKVAYGDHKRQYMYVCYQKGTVPNTDKVIFYIHGGGWHVGRPQSHQALAEVLAQSGYYVVMPAYRLGPKHSSPELKDDIRSAFAKMHDLPMFETQENLDIIVGGTSAGGNLAALLMYDESMREGHQSKIDGFFSLAGAVNLEEMPNSFVVKNYAGQKDSKQFLNANPINHIEGDETTPILCIHGTHDGLVPYKVSTSFVEAVQEKAPAQPVKLHTIEQGTHLSVGSSWYYNDEHDFGQKEMLLEWIESL